jgi:hypothetical protein
VPALRRIAKSLNNVLWIVNRLVNQSLAHSGTSIVRVSPVGWTC